MMNGLNATISWSKGILLGFLVLLAFPAYGQFVDVPDSVYLPGEMIVWFRPGVLNQSFLGCNEDFDATGELPINSDLIQDPNILQYLLQLGAKAAYKVTPNLNPCSDTISFARRGDTVRVPDFWDLLRISFGGEEFQGDIPNMCIFMSYAFQNAIKIAEPNYRFTYYGYTGEDARPLNKSLLLTPNDPFRYNLAYQEYNPAQSKFGSGVYEAWDITTGNSEVLIGLADAGCAGADPQTPQQYGHPDFGSPGTVVIGGYGYAGGPYHNQAQHGTQMGGIIAGLTNNNEYTCGVAGGGFNKGNNVKLAALHTGGGIGGAGSAAMAAAIVEGATKLITNPPSPPAKGHWGCDFLVTAAGPWPDQFHRGWYAHPEYLRAAMAYSYANDVMLATAVDDYGSQLDPWRPGYPGELDDYWVLTVNSTVTPGAYGEYVDANTYGRTTSLIVEYSGGQYTFSCNGQVQPATFQGNSPATAITGGIAALLLSYRKNLQNTGTVPSYFAPEDFERLFAEGVSDNYVTPVPRWYPREKNPSGYGYGITNAVGTLKLIAHPYRLHHFDFGAEITLPQPVVIDSVPIAHPGDYTFPLQNPFADTLYTVEQYHIVLQDVPWTPTLGNGDIYHGIIRAWGRGGKTLGFPPMRDIQQARTNGVDVVHLPLYRNVHWCNVTRFDIDRCDIETYLYRVKQWGQPNWEWLDGIGPNQIRFAVSVLNDETVTAVDPQPESGSFRVSNTYPNPVHVNDGARITVINEVSQMISITLVDVLGRVVREVEPLRQMLPGLQTVSIETNGLDPGLYFVRCAGEETVLTRSLVVAK